MREARVTPDVSRVQNRFTNILDSLSFCGFIPQVLLGAFSSFALELIVQQGIRGSENYCVHEPRSYEHSLYLKELFPNAKFLYIVRDGRAVVHSLMTQKVRTQIEKKLQTYDYQI